MLNSHRINLTQKIIVKHKSLLPMQYRLSELAQFFEIHPRTLASWAEMGLPHSRDNRGHIWIIGSDMTSWIKKQITAKQKNKNSSPLKSNEAYCMRCNKVVRMENILIKPGMGKVVHIQGICIECGGKVNRGGKKDD